jgi:hypothetical protein
MEEFCGALNVFLAEIQSPGLPAVEAFPKKTSTAD